MKTPPSRRGREAGPRLPVWSLLALRGPSVAGAVDELLAAVDESTRARRELARIMASQSSDNVAIAGAVSQPLLP